MPDQFMSLPHILQRQLDVLCGADRSVLDKELEIFFLHERRINEEDPFIIPFPDFRGSPPASAQRRKAA